ncbi:Putative MmgE/PrpD superfamily protein [Septoria linicola]|uniref:MmgE/PrpD superfamily protein n=1 Tax=Septoria linicola TaxID=215465 RepID=A0A9Q9EIF5_9PEZI|nr:putative MmgE/PrpD superfamily protein [Septoria linicola]USW51044.1 Putative MmgE/PrpD superfamily protein [Septoria linicola]
MATEDRHIDNAYDTPPATRLLAAFVADASVNGLNEELRAKIKEVLIDYIGVAVGGLASADSSTPIFNAVTALQGNAIGTCTVIGKGRCMLPQYAGMLNSAFAHSLDFDDTYAEGSLHAGVTAISAAMTQAEVLGDAASIDQFFTAVAVSYEITCRLGRELGTDSYHRGGFHNTGTAGIFGAVSAIAVLKSLPATVVESAFGLAASKAAGSMQYLDNGSWNKRLHPGFAVHDAFVCVALAEAGVVGASKAIEGQYGFLQAYSPKTDKSVMRLTSNLGEEWIWLQSSLKPYPACRMTHTFIEMSGEVHGPRCVKVSDIEAVKLKMPPTNILLIGEPTPNKTKPTNNIDAQFSVYFQVANALLNGSSTGMQAYDKLDNADIEALCAKITVSGDSMGWW